MGYYVGYDVNAYPMASIDWSGITHVIFAPMVVKADQSLDLSFNDENGTGLPASARRSSTRSPMR